MSAGAPVVASDLPAFLRVLDGGRAGATFRNEDAQALADQVVRLAGDPLARAALTEAGLRRARVFDWSVVAEEVLAVYEMVTHGADRVRSEAGDTRWTRLLRGRGRGGDL
jgi:phosphatidylinositol alpha-mannosyltransferase